jgi:two-component system NtrC family sensor kinase
MGRSHWELFPNLPEYWEQNAQACLAGVLEYSEFVAWPPIASVSGKMAGGYEGESVKWVFQPWKNSEGAIGGLILFASEIACDMAQRNRYNKFQCEVKSKQLETIRATNSNSPRKCC